MIKIETILNGEKRYLEMILKEARKRLSTAPKGNIRVRKRNGIVEYYYYNHENEKKQEKTEKKATEKNAQKRNYNGRYLRKREKNVAIEIAQRDYDMQIVRLSEERIKAIEGFLRKYEGTSLKLLYEKINPCRRELIKAYVLSDKEYIKSWSSVEYVGKSFMEDAPEIITERGERVRSKSEKIIADKLYSLGIPYRYECPLILDGNIKMYPDFTILCILTREEVYLEHLGMMDDANYVESVMFKLNTYEKNDIYLGVNLFVTYETSKKPLNTIAVDRMLKKLFVVG